MLGLTETPPRAWGRHALIQSVVPTCGNTPTCVGKTESPITYLPALWKHPHVRGEDATHFLERSPFKETPPRAWGRLTAPETGWVRARNTPTCVGKTWPDTIPMTLSWKHPHVRGEDVGTAKKKVEALETPPRAWGRQIWAKFNRHFRRNTPTCVGKTACSIGPPTIATETPPRAWGRRSVAPYDSVGTGNTPTCVGKTHLGSGVSSSL